MVDMGSGSRLPLLEAVDVWEATLPARALATLAECIRSSFTRLPARIYGEPTILFDELYKHGLLRGKWIDAGESSYTVSDPAFTAFRLGLLERA